MNQYDELTEIHTLKKEDIGFVESTCIPFTARFSNPLLNTKEVRNRLESKNVSVCSESNDIKRISFRNETAMKLSCRFSTYQDDTYDAVKNSFYNQKEAELKLRKRMAKRRMVIPPKKKICSLSKKAATGKSINIPVELNADGDSKISNNVTECSSIKQNGIAIEGTSISSGGINQSAYRWKKVLTKRDLDNELDNYMSEIKLKEPYNQVAKATEESELEEFIQEVDESFLFEDM
ncbi:hypothetical protein NPIL_288151 [Nephila pilipes]|uniref:Chromatin target of PRMT1 protein C-terminal domain-containing protein n=1 Tax=Nephila pilipes TaxID=299642 RepID=A0A8X6QSL9_NEPPI|nr:hypothetical protein NPIL_288151 [Nephila pilipes]